MTDAGRREEDTNPTLRSLIRHRAFLQEAMARFSRRLQERATLHDLSKLLDDEFPAFSRINCAARVHKFGSPEYDEGLRCEAETIRLHYARNSHHPEGRDPLGLVDTIEMVCDWWAAWSGYNDSQRTFTETVALNIERRPALQKPEVVWVVRAVAEIIEGCVA